MLLVDGNLKPRKFTKKVIHGFAAAIATTDIDNIDYDRLVTLVATMQVISQYPKSFKEHLEKSGKRMIDINTIVEVVRNMTEELIKEEEEKQNANQAQ